MMFMNHQQASKRGGVGKSSRQHNSWRAEWQRENERKKIDVRTMIGN